MGGVEGFRNTPLATVATGFEVTFEFPVCESADPASVLCGCVSVGFRRTLLASVATGFDVCLFVIVFYFKLKKEHLSNYRCPSSLTQYTTFLETLQKNKKTLIAER
jgi:hypothetical protein